MTTTSIHGAALRLGIDDNTLYRLVVRDGWLVARRLRPRGMYRITNAALRAFCYDRRLRFLTAPACIPDARLRLSATLAHSADPGRWWSAKEIARASAVSPSLVSTWRRTGWLTGQWLAYGGGFYLYAKAVPVPVASQRKGALCAG